MSRPRRRGASSRRMRSLMTAFAGMRRAFRRDTGEFRDFVLGRLSKAEAGRAAVPRPRTIPIWHSFVALVIGRIEAHAGASAAIAIDYGIRAARP